METPVNFYKRCIKKLLSEYENLNVGSCSTALVFDDERSRYMVMWVGWEGQKNNHSCLIHVEIVGEKIVIQWNDTKELLDEVLLDMGVPRSAIVLGTIPPEWRENGGDSLLYSEAA